MPTALNLSGNTAQINGESRAQTLRRRNKELVFYANETEALIYKKESGQLPDLSINRETEEAAVCYFDLIGF
jgi:hypothetical protein